MPISIDGLLSGANAVDRLGDIPTWIAGIGTVAAVVVALVLAGADGRRRARERRTEQAERITAYYEWPQAAQEPVTALRVVILNASHQLAYRVIASLVPVRGTAPPNFRELQGRFETDYRVFIGELPPGRTERDIDYPGGGSFIRYGVDLVFRDAAGRKWHRDPLGHLDETQKEPAEVVGVHEPLDW